MSLGLRSRAKAGELGPGKPYARTRLVDEHGRPFKVDNLQVGETYIFHYPFVATPCFLINFAKGVTTDGPLETASGKEYNWPGGAGPRRTVVAFSAICAHKMSHPAKSVSFINYRPGEISYMNKKHEPAEGSKLIYCCSERSVYDPRHGARVLGGPARQPLAAIGLEYDGETDSLTATGTYGGEMFDQYFAKFTNRLQLEYRTMNVHDAIGETTLVQTIEDFTRTQILC
ncbi:MAG: hypothetical protein WB783_01345 [Arenicellales bacterium]|jgi:Rieske Fe-S protein